MKSAWVVVVLVSMVLAASAWAQVPLAFTPRSISMGLTPTCDDAAAWLQNPAGLVDLNVDPQEGKEWAHDVSASYISLGGPKGSPIASIDAFRGSWSASKPGKVGVGAGFGDVDMFGRVIGAGVGVALGDTGLSVGANLVNFNPDFPGPPDQTLLNGGVMYRINPIKIGVTIIDLTDELPIGPFFNVQGMWEITPALRVAAEVRDISGEIPGMNTPWSVGGEWDFATGSKWTVRGGLVDLGIPGLDIMFAGGLAYQFDRYRVEGGVLSPLSGPAVPDMNYTWTVGGGVSF